MLNVCKQTYLKVADAIPGWRTANKNDLMRKCAEIEGVDKDKYEAYMAAIMLRYWNAIWKFKQQYPYLSDADCHEWLTHAVLYQMQNKPWTKEEVTKSAEKRTGDNGKVYTTSTILQCQAKNKIYGDPNGPDKSMNKCIEGVHKLYDEQHSRTCRAIHYNGKLDSIERMYEDKEDYLLPKQREEKSMENQWAEQLIKDTFKEKNYIQAFILDAIAFNNPFNIKAVEERLTSEEIAYVNSFRATKLKMQAREAIRDTKLVNVRIKYVKGQVYKHLSNFDENYCKIFSEHYNLDRKQVMAAAKDMLDGFETKKFNKYYKSTFTLMKSKLKYYTDVPEMECEL